MAKKKMNFFSLKPRESKEDIRNYNAYKEVLDFCFDPQNEINNIGIVGDYGTGKSTIINTYIKNEIDKNKYDVIPISLLTLEDDGSDTLVLLKNIIKQIVQNPKKNLEYNILKFKGFVINKNLVAVTATFLLLFLTIFFMNTNLLSKIPTLNIMLDYVPIEVFRILKYFLLGCTLFLFITYLYPRLLSGIKINKFNIASAFNAEVENSYKSLSNDEFDYLEYLIYLLKRKEEKKLLLVIEDIDRYENLKIFQQLREVNNLLNENDSQNKYKFIYAVGNTLFSEYKRKDKVSFKESYQSEFKENVTKFFDFVVNVTPVMDNQNSYEFIKNKFPELLADGGVREEDLFMISQYISSPRILMDVMNDYQIMKDMHTSSDKKEFQDFKLLYFAILKSRFYNFYELIHEVMSDLQKITNLYSNEDEYKRLENTRKDKFISMGMFHANNLDRNVNIDISTLASIWSKIKDEPNFSVISTKHSRILIYSKYGSKLYLSELLNEFSDNQMEYIFSAEEYRKRRGNKILPSKRSVSDVVSLYYKENTELITKIIKDVENLRFNDPNKSDFSIKEFLDIDYVKLGIIEGLLDPNDYNIYISNNYLEVNDATFIKSFNLYDEQPDLFILKLYDFQTIISKMKLSKIVDSNGLNVYMIYWLHTNKNHSDKGRALKVNGVNQADFLKTFLEYEFEEEIDKLNFIKSNIYQVNNQPSLRVIINWINTNLSEIDEQDITDIFSAISIKNNFSLLEEVYAEEIYFKLISFDIADLSTDSILIFILEKVKYGYHKLLNIIIDKYSESFLEDDFKNNEWLNYFNDNIASYIDLINSENIELIKKIYAIVRTVKIIQLANITRPVFLEFIYEKNYYMYSVENINFICCKFEEGTLSNYKPYVSYSISNVNQSFEFIKNNDLSLDLNNPWDNEFLVQLLTDAEFEMFESYLQLIEEYNPVMFPSLELLNLDLEKIVFIANYIDLYENTLKNLTYIYDVLAENDDSQIELIDAILEREEFDFDLLYTDISEIESNKDIAKLIYNGILKNTGISIQQFEKYVEATHENFENVKLASSDEKLKILYNHNKAPYTFDVLSEYDTELLTFLFEEKEEHILQTLTKLNIEEVLHLLLKLDNPSIELRYLRILLQNEALDTTMQQTFIVSYLQAVDECYSLNELENTFLSLLREMKTDDTSINKLIALLSNKKGQRTISNEFSEFVEFLDKKNLTKHTIQRDDKIKVEYIKR